MDELPDSSLIIRPRLLAIRTSVTQSLAPEMEATTRAQALPFETVSIEPFIVGPDGPIDPGVLDPVWLACELPPAAGLGSCIRAAIPIDFDDLVQCPTPSFDDLEGEELPEPPSPCFIARAGSPEFTVPFSPNSLIGGQIELTMVSGEPGEISTDACLDPFLAGESDLPDRCLYGVQRLNLGPPEYLASVLAGFGVEIPGFEAPDPEDVPEPDRNPRILEVKTAILDDDGEPGELVVVAAGDSVQLDLDEMLRIEITQPEDDLQTYEVPINDGEDFEETQEVYDGRYYRTWGETLSLESDDPDAFNEWSFVQGLQDEDASPPDDRAFLYYVVRDGRQGVDWFWLEARRPE